MRLNKRERIGIAEVIHHQGQITAAPGGSRERTA